MCWGGVLCGRVVYCALDGIPCVRAVHWVGVAPCVGAVYWVLLFRGREIIISCHALLVRVREIIISHTGDNYLARGR